MKQQRNVLQTKHVYVNEQKIFYRVSSPAPTSPIPVIMVHGFVVSGRYFIRLARQMAPLYRCYVPDLPGFGNSSDPDHTLDIPGLADALLNWMQAVGLKQAIFIGNSLGCQIVTEAAVRNPDTFLGAVLIGPTIDPHAHSLWAEFCRWFTDMFIEPLSLHPIMFLDLLQIGIPRALRTLKYTLEDHIEERLPHIHVPALVIRGSHDPLVSQQWAEEAAQLLPQGQLHVLQGCSHAVNHSCPAALSQIIHTFINDKITHQPLTDRDVEATLNSITG